MQRVNRRVLFPVSAAVAAASMGSVEPVQVSEEVNVSTELTLEGLPPEILQLILFFLLGSPESLAQLTCVSRLMLAHVKSLCESVLIPEALKEVDINLQCDARRLFSILENRKPEFLDCDVAGRLALLNARRREAAGRVVVAIAHEVVRQGEALTARQRSHLRTPLIVGLIALDQLTIAEAITQSSSAVVPWDDLSDGQKEFITKCGLSLEKALQLNDLSLNRIEKHQLSKLILVLSQAHIPRPIFWQSVRKLIECSMVSPSSNARPLESLSSSLYLLINLNYDLRPLLETIREIPIENLNILLLVLRQNEIFKIFLVEYNIPCGAFMEYLIASSLSLRRWKARELFLTNSYASLRFFLDIFFRGRKIAVSDLEKFGYFPLAVVYSVAESFKQAKLLWIEARISLNILNELSESRVALSFEKEIIPCNYFQFLLMLPVSLLRDVLIARNISINRVTSKIHEFFRTYGDKKNNHSFKRLYDSDNVEFTTKQDMFSKFHAMVIATENVVSWRLPFFRSDKTDGIINYETIVRELEQLIKTERVELTRSPLSLLYNPAAIWHNKTIKTEKITALETLLSLIRAKNPAEKILKWIRIFCNQNTEYSLTDRTIVLLEKLKDYYMIKLDLDLASNPPPLQCQPTSGSNCP
jgi:hypothetical protein